MPLLMTTSAYYSDDRPTSHILPPILRIPLHRIAGIGRISPRGLDVDYRYATSGQPLSLDRTAQEQEGLNRSSAQLSNSGLPSIKHTSKLLQSYAYACLASLNSTLVTAIDPAHDAGKKKP